MFRPAACGAPAASVSAKSSPPIRTSTPCCGARAPRCNTPNEAAATAGRATRRRPNTYLRTPDRSATDRRQSMEAAARATGVTALEATTRSDPRAGLRWEFVERRLSWGLATPRFARLDRIMSGGGGRGPLNRQHRFERMQPPQGEEQ